MGSAGVFQLQLMKDVCGDADAGGAEGDGHHQSRGPVDIGGKQLHGPKAQNEGSDDADGSDPDAGFDGGTQFMDGGLQSNHKQQKEQSDSGEDVDDLNDIDNAVALGAGEDGEQLCHLGGIELLLQCLFQCGATVEGERDCVEDSSGFAQYGDQIATQPVANVSNQDADGELSQYGGLLKALSQLPPHQCKQCNHGESKQDRDDRVTVVDSLMPAPGSARQDQGSQHQYGLKHIYTVGGCG